MKRCLLLVCLLPLCGFFQSSATDKKQGFLTSEQDTTDYEKYHRTISEAEGLLANQKYEEAFVLLKQAIDNQDFVFLRDYKLATQLALQVGKTNESFTYLKKGIANGWEMKSIKKNTFLRKLQGYPEWKDIESQYALLRQHYHKRINPEVREIVKKMSGKDQWKALRALFTFGSKGQDRYAEKKFAPHSEKQIAKLDKIIETYGYPGEKLIGNDFWASVILSHHNSISEQYALKDTLYPYIRPKLLRAIQLGQMSPYEFAMIDNWYISVKSGHKEKAYGYLTTMMTEAERAKADQLRQEIGLCNVETINCLIAVQQQTGINLYLPLRPDFASGKITITN